MQRARTARRISSPTRAAPAPVVYSDRYFFYGLSLRFKTGPLVHHVPLPTLTPPHVLPGAVVLVSYARPDRSRRYGSVRRARRDLPRLFGTVQAPGVYPARRLPLECRQPAGGARPRYAPVVLTGRHSLPASRPHSGRGGEGEGRDIYDVLYEAYCGSRQLASRLAGRVTTRARPDRPTEVCPDLADVPRVDHTHGLDETKPDVSKYIDVSAQYEVLPDTVQYELLPDASQTYSVPYGVYRPDAVRYVARRGERSARAQRAAVRCVLAASGALYALAFIAFYFLSL